MKTRKYKIVNQIACKRSNRMQANQDCCDNIASDSDTLADWLYVYLRCDRNVKLAKLCEYAQFVLFFSHNTTNSTD